MICSQIVAYMVLICFSSASNITSPVDLRQRVEVSGKPFWIEHAQNQSRLVKALLDDKTYDKRIRPNFGDKPLVVYVDMMISNIWSIEEVNMDFTIDCYLRQYWQDSRLAYRGIYKDVLLTLNRQTVQQIWVPSTYFYNAKKSYFHDVTTDNYLLILSPSGDIFYSVRLTVTTACTLDFHKFPHDTQICSIMIESYGYQAKDLVYKWKFRNGSSISVVLAESLDMPQFKIGHIKLEDKINVYNIGKHSALKATIEFHRRLGYYIIETYVPSILTVMISWFSFWISPDSPPARVGLGITTVLTMITISNSARAPLPKVSYTKALDWFLLMCIVFVFGALMEYAVVNFYSKKESKKRKLYGPNYPRRREEKEEYIPLQPPETKIEMEGGVPGEKAPEPTETETTVPSVAHKRAKYIPFFFGVSATCSWKRRSKSHSDESEDESTTVKTPEMNGNHQGSKERSSSSRSYFFRSGDKSKGISSRSNRIDQFSRLFFPLAFIVLNVIYWVIYAPQALIF